MDKNKYITKHYGNFFVARFFLALILLSGIFLFGLIFEARGAEGTPQILSYQGRLTNSSGSLLGDSGTTFYFRFSIHNSASGGSQLWPFNDATPCTHTRTVREGVFTAGIGDTAECADVLNFDFRSNENIYLQVAVSDTGDNLDFETLNPRQRITSAPFAQVKNAGGGFTKQ